MEHQDERYIVRGIPKIRRDLAKAISRKIYLNENEGRLVDENPHLREIIDFRQFEVCRNLQGKIKANDLRIEEVGRLSRREFLVEASVVYLALYDSSIEGAKLSEESGLPILTEKMGTDRIRFYLESHRLTRNSNEFIDFLGERDPLLYGVLENLSLENLERSKRSPLDIQDIERIKNRFKEMGNLGSEILYYALRSQNQSYRLDDQLSLG